MTAVAGEDIARKQTTSAEHPCHHRQLEHDSHNEHERKEIIHVGIKRYLIGYGCAYLILSQKTERERKDEEISDKNAGIEHRRASKQSTTGSTPLSIIQSRGDESPNLLKQEREREHNGKPERGGYVNEKLRGEMDIYQRDVA